MSNRKPHNHLAGYVCELKSYHPKLPGHFGIFDKKKGGSWITGEDGNRYGVAHLKPDNSVGGVVTFTSILSARILMQEMAGGSNVADFGQHTEAKPSVSTSLIHLQFIPTDVTDGSEKIPDCSGKGHTLVQALADLETNLMALHGPEAAFEHTLFVGHADTFFEILDVVGGDLHCHDFSSPEQAFRIVRQPDLELPEPSIPRVCVEILPEDFILDARESTLTDADLSVPEGLLDLAGQHYGKPDSIVIGQLYKGEDYILCIDEQIPDEREALLAGQWPPRFLDYLEQLHREGHTYIRIFA